MQFKKGLIALALVGLTLILSLSNSGCANIIPPTGGPRDSLPPVLVNATPADSSLHFTDNKIVLTFDEYVQLDNKLNEELIVSPNPQQVPSIMSKLKTVTIRLKDSLQPNTTYAIDFGNSIRDVNEGNPYKNFTYVFSTGNKLDEGTLSGKVLIARTGQPDSTLIVALYKNLNDSAVKKLRPDYYTRIDSAGNFHFRFLPQSDFAIYVLENDYAKRYDDSTKTFAFYDTTVNPASTGNISLFAYRAVEPQEKPSQISNENTKSGPAEKLKITTNLDGNELDILGDLTVKTNRKIESFDSTGIVLSDTNFIKIAGYSISTDTSLQSLSLKYPWPQSTDYILMIAADAIKDSLGNGLAKSDTIRFSTKSESDYGSVRLHFNNLDLSRNPVLQIFQEDKLIESVPLTSADWYRKLYYPGEYNLRILWDENKNGVWDPGNFDAKIQPEKVSRITRKINIKMNWDNEIDISL